MKKIILVLLLLLPIEVLAYSDYIIPGGQTVGIEVNNEGVMVVGFYRVNHDLNKNNLKIGDTIIKVNDEPVFNIQDFVSMVEKLVVDNKVNITIKRNDKVFETPLELAFDDGVLKTGLYVKDSITGIGTLSYIDPETLIYGALGHEITEGASGSLIEVREGKIFQSSIIRIEPSVRGLAGTKHARFNSNNIFGTIIKNSRKGIYGTYTGDISSYETMEVGSPKELTEGTAYIYTVLSQNEITKHEINIKSINLTSDTKNIQFEIISEEILNSAGGIVQGMSGSPIIQNNKIFGAVTHVIIDNPTNGYGIFITSMLTEGER